MTFSFLFSHFPVSSLSALSPLLVCHLVLTTFSLLLREGLSLPTCASPIAQGHCRRARPCQRAVFPTLLLFWGPDREVGAVPSYRPSLSLRSVTNRSSRTRPRWTWVPCRGGFPRTDPELNSYFPDCPNTEGPHPIPCSPRLSSHLGVTLGSPCASQSLYHPTWFWKQKCGTGNIS